MTTHELKVWPRYFQEVAEGRKTFEVRLNGRGFREGDRLRLREYTHIHDRDGAYTGREVTVDVSYLMEGGRFGLDPDFVVMAFAPVTQQKVECRS